MNIGKKLFIKIGGIDFRKWFATLTWCVALIISLCIITFFTVFPMADIPYSFISEVCRFPDAPRPIPTIIYFLVPLSKNPLSESDLVEDNQDKLILIIPRFHPSFLSRPSPSCSTTSSSASSRRTRSSVAAGAGRRSESPEVSDLKPEMTCNVKFSSRRLRWSTPTVSEQSAQRGVKFHQHMLTFLYEYFCLVFLVISYKKGRISYENLTNLP